MFVIVFQPEGFAILARTRENLQARHVNKHIGICTDNECQAALRDLAATPFVISHLGLECRESEELDDSHMSPRTFCVT